MNAGGRKSTWTEADKQALQLIIAGSAPKDAIAEAGCNFATGSKQYRRICQAARREKKRKLNQEAIQKEQEKADQEAALLQPHRDSVQRHRHDANRCV